MTWLASLVSGIALVLDLSMPAFGQRASLENPAHFSYTSGIGLISGWACEAYSIEVYILQRIVQAVPGGPVLRQDGFLGPFTPSYGTARGDTLRACGDTNNGFGLLFNWNLLGMGVTVWPCL